MPYKCVHCSETYDDGSKEVLTGCGKCGGKFFFYLRKEKLNELQEQQESNIQLEVEEKKQMEADVRDIAGVENEEVPVYLDFESVKVLKPGKYLLDIGKLFSANKPRVYQLEDGKYIIDFAGSSKKEVGGEK